MAKRVKISILFLILLCLTGVFGAVLSNSDTFDNVFFLPNELDTQNTGAQKPGSIQLNDDESKTHYLGTDRLGRDVLAGIINGASISTRIVFGAVAGALTLGLFIGLTIGYFGDNKLKVKRLHLYNGIISIFIILFHSPITQKHLVSLVAWLVLIQLLFMSLQKLNVKNPSISLPIDLWISRFIEVFNSIPKIILLIAIFAGLEASIWKLIIIISLLSWPNVTMLVRSEVLKEKNKEYILSASLLGISNANIILKHILPNIITPILVHASFLAGSVILLESSLSFLGLGLPADVMTWGKMLSSAKTQIYAWWLVIFPGFFIFASVYSLNALGGYFNRKIGSYRIKKDFL